MNIESRIETCSEEDRQFIGRSLGEYNLSKVPVTVVDSWVRIDFKAVNETNEIIGGIMSFLGVWGGLEVKNLWVREDQRYMGLGSKLLEKAEQKAISLGATICFLDTFEFQAKDFYLKKGYELFGEHRDFPKGFNRYYFTKKLAN